MLRRVLAALFVTAAFATLVTQSPANAECPVNVGTCTSGDCLVNLLTCSGGGQCEVNAGTCAGGNCTVNVLSCSGTCIVNVGTCGSGESCTVKVLTCVDPISDAVLCLGLKLVAGSYVVVDIAPQGDVYVDGEMWWDCPPYGG